MSNAAHHIVAVFSFVDTTKEAIKQLQNKGVKSFELYMPTFIHELAEAVDHKTSPIRFVTLTGGLIGLACAIAMTAWMSMDWPLRTSMKPVLSWPTFTVIMFELIILLGGLFNLMALLGFAKLPQVKLPKGFDPRFTDDKFGLIVTVTEDQKMNVTEILKTAGAEEIEYVAA